MVSISTIIGVCITLFISLILPIVIYIIYGIKNKGKGVWTAWLLGAAGFFVMQVIIRLPILNLLSLIPSFGSFVENHFVFYCLILAFSAGLFEVAGRYAVAKILSKNLLFEKGIAAGLGHGGIEAIFLIGLTYINNLIYILMIRSGSFDSIVEQTEKMGVSTTSLLQIKESLIQTKSILFYLAGYERILTMIFHVGLSLLVCYFVWKKKDFLGIIICLLLHGIVDFIVPLINNLATPYLGNKISSTLAYLLSYGFLTFIAAASIGLIWYIKNKWKRENKLSE